MRKLLFLLSVSVIALASCCSDCDGIPEIQESQIRHIATYKGNLFDVVVIDSCEYIVNNYRFAHKGNCRFCRERQKKQENSSSLDVFDTQQEESSSLWN